MDDTRMMARGIHETVPLFGASIGAMGAITMSSWMLTVIYVRPRGTEALRRVRTRGARRG